MTVNVNIFQLSYVGFDLESLPQQLIEDYCNVTSLLDLSYNKLRQVLMVFIIILFTFLTMIEKYILLKKVVV